MRMEERENKYKGGEEGLSLFLSLRYNLIRDICAQAGSFSLEET